MILELIDKFLDTPDKLKWHKWEIGEGGRYNVTGRVKEISGNKVELTDPGGKSPYTLILKVDSRYAELLGKKNARILYIWGDLRVYPNVAVLSPEKDDKERLLVEIKV